MDDGYTNVKQNRIKKRERRTLKNCVGDKGKNRLNTGCSENIILGCYWSLRKRPANRRRRNRDWQRVENFEDLSEMKFRNVLQWIMKNAFFLEHPVH